MKTLYFDSNYLFRLYSTEHGASQVQKLSVQADLITTAWHGRAELASILLRKRREAALSEALVEEIRRQMQDDVRDEMISFFPLTEAVMSRLESVLATAPPKTNIRAADALHLACAAENGFTEVFSNDKLFLNAAPLFGLKGVNVIPEQ